MKTEKELEEIAQLIYWKMEAKKDEEAVKILHDLLKEQLDEERQASIKNFPPIGEDF